MEQKAGRRGQGVAIIPDRIRQAREEAGLSLAQLSGTDFSRAFAHQLEQGKSRPSLEVLQLIAARTGKPIEFFLDMQAEPGAVSTAQSMTALANQLRGLRRRCGNDAERALLTSLMYLLRSTAPIVADVEVRSQS